MKKNEFIFLGGIFTSRQYQYVNLNSIGVIQNAADVLQKKIIEGLDVLTDGDVYVVNLPFVGSYPKLFKKFYFPGKSDTSGNKTFIKTIGYINIWAVKLISRFFSAFYGLLLCPTSKQAVVFVYSAHLPFILSVLLVRLFRPSLKICLIVPDLPEFMGDGGLLYSSFKRIDSYLFYYFSKKFDYFVVLTKYMAEKMCLDSERVVVIEGIASNDIYDGLKSQNLDNLDIKSFFYSGTLARRYGITNLIDAFSKISEINAELWICGNGDAKEYVEFAARNDKRIKYFGQIARDEVIRLQMQATVLVNPRLPDGEYTRYSFPSKIMEYMASGRPVIMYKLEGIPDEYDPYYFTPDSFTVDALAECMKSVIAMPNATLEKIGNAAKKFVIQEKNPVMQSRKILNLVMENPK